MKSLSLNPIRNNMTELSTPEALILFSYKTPVACRLDKDMNWYKTSKKWSKTTSRHINQWLDGIHASEKPQEFFDNLTNGSV